ncbi:hypothetical protein Q31b_41830 [Novipirellula aureliae]|uniref:Cytochrome c domain-containing protein n=1 Tax=Novipirellula aureliae TaxID=2527966 RepID=A0A5C6DQI8_9BACT|nr:DUF1549 domain-containing protein [Novipirellula aureliae]TWU39100.1 hypothetical protein Q31b_41830 [Novipirellula aureliae]
MVFNRLRLLFTTCLLLSCFGFLAVSNSNANDTVKSQVERINDAIEQGWSDYEIRPAPVANDAVWCRRVYLDILGRIPTLEELNEFLAIRGTDNRAKLIQTLLYDDRYTEEYANHWGTIWTNILIGRSGGMDNREMTNRDGLQKYLRDSFAFEKPYDTMVRELITATGTTKPGTKDFNGAVNFLIDKVNADDAVLATSSTSRIFLGQQVQCTQCHNHPFNQWKQQKFWEFNSFFRQTRGLRRFVDGTRDVAYGELANQDFAGEANDPEDALIFYELRNGLTRVAYPVFTDGTEIPKSGYLADVNRREELGHLMMESEFLDKMIVNRIWSHFLGFGFTKPIDDLGPHNPSSHPALLDSLGKAFRDSSYDLKQLMTWITMSKPYQLAAVLGKANQIDDPSIGEMPKFSRFYLRQMSAEQLYQSLVTATDAGAVGSYEEQERQRREWLKQFVVAFGTDEGDEATTFNGSIPQALMLFNGDLTRQATSIKPGSFLDRIQKDGKTTRDRLTSLYMAAVARRPTRNEIAVAAKLYAARQNNELEMLQDMWWALLNSNEFILQH